MQYLWQWGWNQAAMEVVRVTRSFLIVLFPYFRFSLLSSSTMCRTCLSGWSPLMVPTWCQAQMLCMSAKAADSRSRRQVTYQGFSVGSRLEKLQQIITSIVRRKSAWIATSCDGCRDTMLLAETAEEAAAGHAAGRDHTVIIDESQGVFTCLSWRWGHGVWLWIRYRVS